MVNISASDFWLGMTDEVDEGAWVWSETQTPAVFLDWNPGEPDDYPHIEEDCAAFGHKVGLHWIDVPCTSSRSPACESKLVLLLFCLILFPSIYFYLPPFSAS